jgi:hypothetical protein
MQKAAGTVAMRVQEQARSRESFSAMARRKEGKEEENDLIDISFRHLPEGTED